MITVHEWSDHKYRNLNFVFVAIFFFFFFLLLLVSDCFLFVLFFFIILNGNEITYVAENEVMLMTKIMELTHFDVIYAFLAVNKLIT